MNSTVSQMIQTMLGLPQKLLSRIPIISTDQKELVA